MTATANKVWVVVDVIASAITGVKTFRGTTELGVGATGIHLLKVILVL